MSDKSYTPASGASYQVRRGVNGSHLVKKEGEATENSISLSASAAAIDSQTQRLHVSVGENRKMYWVYARGNKRVLSWPGGSIELDASDLSDGNAAGAGSLKPLKLTMPGKVLGVKVAVGDIVEAGQALVIVEAMKMENILLSSARAKVSKVHIKEGDRFESGSTLITFEAAE